MKSVLDAAAAEVARTLTAMDAAETAHYRAMEALDLARTLQYPRGIAKAERALRAAHKVMWDARRAHWAARDAEFMAGRAADAARAEEAMHRQDVPFHGASDMPGVDHG